MPVVTPIERLHEEVEKLNERVEALERIIQGLSLDDGPADVEAQHRAASEARHARRRRR